MTPLGGLPVPRYTCYLTYTTFALSHSQESPESVASGAGWVYGLLWACSRGRGDDEAARFRPFLWSERGLSEIRPVGASDFSAL